MATLLRFPVERTRTPARSQSQSDVLAMIGEPAPLDELMKQARNMGGWLHYCGHRFFRRFIIKAGHNCPVCGCKP